MIRQRQRWCPAAPRTRMWSSCRSAASSGNVGSDASDRYPVIDARCSTSPTGSMCWDCTSRCLPATQVMDWAAIRADTADNDFAAAFLVLMERLGIVDEP